MDPPPSLPARLYLLAYDLRRNRLTGRTWLPLAVRAAALEDLRLQGWLEDDGGKVRVRNLRTLAEPVLDAVLHEVGQGRPRSWSHWLAAGGKRTARAVRDQLDDRLYLRVEERRVLGIFPSSTVSARDPRVIEHLQHHLVRTLTAGPSVSHVDPRDAALVAFAALGGLDSVFPRHVRREHKKRITEFVDRVSPTAAAMKRAIQQQQAVSASAGG